MNKKEYAQLLRDDRWKKLRSQILKRDKYECVKCGKKRCELHVHHTIYITGKNPWEYNTKHLQTLCVDCHKEIHDNFNIPVLQSNEKAIVFIEKGKSAKPKKIHDESRLKKKKLKPWEKKEHGLKNRIASLGTREDFIQKIGELYYKTNRRNIKKRQETLYEIRKIRREYVNQFGTNYEGMPIELVNKFFLDYDG